MVLKSSVSIFAWAKYGKSASQVHQMSQHHDLCILFDAKNQKMSEYRLGWRRATNLRTTVDVC